MTAVPEVAIEDFCETGSGGTPDRKKSKYYGGSIPWVKSGELRENVILDTEEKITEAALSESSAKLVPSGSILLAMYGATVGRMAFLGIDAATNQAVCNIRPDPKRADARYVFHGLQSKMNHFISRAAGGAQPNISQGIVRETKLLLPPLDEQRRIATILDKADSLRRVRRHAIELSQSLTQIAFVTMFGDPKVVPSRWPLLDFASACEDRTSFSGKIPRSAYAESGKIPIIDQGQTTIAGWTDDIDLKTTVERPVIVFGDHTRIVKYIDFDFVIGADGAKVLLPSQRFVPLFFAELLKLMPISDLGYSRHMRVVKKLDFPCPPLKLQTKFAGQVRAIRNCIAMQRQDLDRFDEMFSSLQHRAFSGQL